MILRRKFQQNHGGNIYGCFLKWWYPQIIHFNRVFHYKPSNLGYPYFWKHPYVPQVPQKYKLWVWISFINPGVEGFFWVCSGGLLEFSWNDVFNQEKKQLYEMHHVIAVVNNLIGSMYGHGICTYIDPIKSTIHVGKIIPVPWILRESKLTLRWDHEILVGGFNPFEKYYCSENGNLP